MIKDRSGELVQGTLDMLILKTLTYRSLHGYAIALAIHERSDETLRVEEGSLYPALHRLELAGFLEGEWKLSEANRRAKFYRITPKGRKHLAAESQNWARLAGGIAKIMETA
jgi:transcriptional regulator